ncbi:hypothetical protein O6H91_20G058600 [Diphasiastrum complanatum]|uniref:Uncharacterized protein n=3 Tax=Diphasiastrum complanatum TaxID=34168 RepID=A0ACC2AQP3_DIPCM|nr:hypothetical protein O6H91_20G058600 [Diphasiastrum complanatum]KAJ7519859.1 hypothetical protein O6H91_20G058600 [Diphasiastrum complanatum]KAJ7519860.1 hypothetical protein O6H91_20G058600 [Diphasiastrum complanatum]
MQIFMSERIWGRLPEELVDAILAHLPIPVLLRLRAVCKRWNALLSCTGFLHLCSQVPQKRPYLLFTGLDFILRKCICEGLIFCPSSSRWYRFPLDFLPFPSENIIGVTGGGGLLLVCSALYSAELVVTNPVTRAWKILPTFHRSSSRPSLAALVVNKSKATYTIVAAYDSDMTTYVYESFTNVWTKTANMSFDAQMRPVVCNGIMYCVHDDDITLIGAYDIEKGQWSTFKVLSGAQLRFMENLFDPQTHSQLVESCGRLLLITSIQEMDSQASARTGGIHVWEVRPERQRKKCNLVEKMPDNLMTYFQDGFDVFAFHNAEHEEALLFIACNSPDAWRTSTLLYDLVEKSWEWTRVPLSPEFIPMLGFSGFPMELSLTSLP